MSSLTLAQLQERYHLNSRQAVHNRINHLISLGWRKDLEEDSEFMAELDRLHLYLQQPGAQMQGYSSDGQLARVQVVGESTGLSSGLTPSAPEPRSLWELVEAIAARLTPAAPDTLALQAQLQRIYDNGWTATTSQLQQILGTRPTEGSCYGFHLVKAGRQGRQTAWSVKKPDRG